MFFLNFNYYSRTLQENSLRNIIFLISLTHIFQEIYIKSKDNFASLKK